MIPLEYGIPALGVAFVIYQIRAQMIARTLYMIAQRRESTEVDDDSSTHATPRL